MTQAKTAFTITLDSGYYNILIDISDRYKLKSRSAGITQALALANAYMRLMDASDEQKKQNKIDEEVVKKLNKLRKAEAVK